jgi:hypothetical protein
MSVGYPHIGFLGFVCVPMHSHKGETTMRGTYYRDWIAWSLLAAIIIIAATEYYVQTTTGMTTPEYVYKIVVTPNSQ